VVYKNCACNFYIPSAFSPNNDGKNDVFRSQYSCSFSSYEMKIYNRWGQQVFVSTNVANGWDGTFKSQPQPADVYIWQLKYEDNLTGKLVRRNGTVMLMR
jgi:gliding motility-associated-like protein